MNKRQVEKLIPKAIDALKQDKFQILKKDSQGNSYIEKGFRSQISSFGAAVTMGSFSAAVAFFANDGSSDVDRSKLICLMYYIIKNEILDAKIILSEIISIQDHQLLAQMKEDFINASIALKLALNAFYLKDDPESKENNK